MKPFQNDIINAVASLTQVSKLSSTFISFGDLNIRLDTGRGVEPWLTPTFPTIGKKYRRSIFMILDGAFNKSYERGLLGNDT